MFTGRTALVTGASRGIGAVTALRLAGLGARVAVLARGADALGALAAQIASYAPEPLVVVADLRDPAAVDAAVARVADAFGGAPDILVNNAGLFALEPVDELAADAFDAIVDVNLAAPFRVARAFLPAMRARGGGHVVTIGSVADRQVFPGNAAYAAAKHGLRALHEVMRLELRGTGVRCTLVSPGPVDTELWDPIDPDHREGFTPRAQMLDAEEVVAAVVFALTRPAAVNVDELRLGRA